MKKPCIALYFYFVACKYSGVFEFLTFLIDDLDQFFLFFSKGLLQEVNVQATLELQ